MQDRQTLFIPVKSTYLYKIIQTCCRYCNHYHFPSLSTSFLQISLWALLQSITMYLSTIVQLLLVTTITAAPVANRAKALLRARDAAPLALLNEDVNQDLEDIEEHLDYNLGSDIITHLGDIDPAAKKLLSSREAAPVDKGLDNVGLDIVIDVDTLPEILAREVGPLPIVVGPDGLIHGDLSSVGGFDVGSIVSIPILVGG
jgi:hypothetical protein